MTSANPRARHQVLGVVALALFAALFTRLWYLQVLTTDEFAQASDSNRTQEVIVEAPRGRILDRTGKTLVQNRRTLQVTVDYQDFVALEDPEQGEVLRRLARELTEDQYYRYEGLLQANDPGSAAPDEVTPRAGTDDAEGGPDTTVADPAAPPGEEAAVDPTTRPPAGVATGAANPDGQSAGLPTPPVAVTEEILRERIDDPRYSKFKPVPVATGVSEQLEIYIRENPELFPTVAAERTTVRDYRYGALLAHVLGYVGAINGDELTEFQNDQKPYENDDDIGKTGIERGMEAELRGKPGRIVYEVDLRNRPIRKLSERAPEAGNDVYLTVDINLQYLMEKGLAAEVERRRGVRDNGCFVTACDPPGAASVALDPTNGQVLAMASYPTYDPNLFVGGISKRDFDAISKDDLSDIHHDPLSNRAIAGSYAPGSTFKVFTAFAGLATGEITPGYRYNDTGVYRFNENESAQNAGAVALGSVDLAESLTRSSDTYYYKVGNEAWLSRDAIGETALQDQMVTWGLGSPTGIALPSEAPGRIPTPAWLRDFSDQLHGEGTPAAEENGRWSGGVSANTAVGQGDVLVTPLQLANGYATLANGGAVYLPQLVAQVTRSDSDSMVAAFEKEATGIVDLRPEWRGPLVAGLDGVTKPGAGGTASGTFSGFDQSSCPVAGKTGTAQADDKNDSSLFVAFAPTQAPTITISAVFEQAGFGSSAAAPLIRRLLEPFAAGGCTIDPAGDVRSAYPEAPLGGWFDVEAAMAEFTPTVTDRED